MKITVHQAILSLNPSAEASIKGNKINDCEITWHNSTPEISKADIKAEMENPK
jgi:hypothetical protein